MDINDPIVNAITSGGMAVITGTPRAGRDGLYRVLEVLGLSVSISVSRRTQLLIVCEDPKQDKVDKAASLGVPICTEQELREAIALVYTDEIADQLEDEAKKEILIYAKKIEA